VVSTQSTTRYTRRVFFFFFFEREKTCRIFALYPGPWMPRNRSRTLPARDNQHRARPEHLNCMLSYLGVSRDPCRAVIPHPDPMFPELCGPPCRKGQAQPTTRPCHAEPSPPDPVLPRGHGRYVYFSFFALAPLTFAVPRSVFCLFLRCLRCCLLAFSILEAKPTRTSR
jgi:hypothetical protein